MIPEDLPGQINDLYRRFGELERRFQNKERTGKVVQRKKSDDGKKLLYRIELLPDDGTGKPYLSPWIQRREKGAGVFKTHVPLSIGEQATLVSQSGDLVDAEIVESTQSGENPAPSDKFDEYLLGQVGDFEMMVSDGGATAIIKVGATELKLTAGKLQVKAPDVEFIQS